MRLPGSSIRSLGRFRWLLAALLLAGCGGEGGDEEITGVQIEARDPDRFLEYFNPRAGLAPSEYEVTAARASSSGATPFRLAIDRSRGPMEVREGTWQDGEAEVTFTFRVERPAGVDIRLESAATNRLALAHPGSSRPIAAAEAAAAGEPARIERPLSGIDSRRYAAAYYQAVDPLEERTTLADWKAASGFDDCVGEVVEVRFRDTKDLGYGRHMRVCTETPDGGMATFVDNYQVAPLPQLAYSPLNLEAVLARDGKWTIGTNAIEFTRPQASDGMVLDTEPHIAKFFAFTPWSEGQPQRRELTADLDGRGQKAMPMICVQCHGGRLLPLEPDGSLPRLRTGGNPGLPGDVDAKMQPLEVDTFDFPDSGPFSRASQEEALRRINAAVHRSFTTGDYGDTGEWNPGFTRDLLDGWYGGDVNASGAIFDSAHVPDGWQPDAAAGSPPEGADRLFREVVGPRCIVCHGKRGTSWQSDVDFATFDKFVGHAEQMDRLIYEEGLMPSARIEFEAFWADDGPEGEAALLGSFLPGFDHGRADGTVDRPGAPVANAGPDRTVAGLPVTLSAEDSAFASGYRWELVSAPGGAQLSAAGSARAVIEAGGGEGRYVVRLTVTGGGGSSSDEVTITVDGTATVAGLDVAAPRALRFDDGNASTADIRAILQTSFGVQECSDCHSDSGGYPGIPVFWTDDGSDADIDRLYRDAMARVNLRDPLASLLLRKPSGFHHNGGTRPGFVPSGAPQDRLAHDLVYTWIVEGAPR
jgi:mono/diheme cytochrome c family protein